MRHKAAAIAFSAISAGYILFAQYHSASSKDKQPNSNIRIVDGYNSIYMSQKQIEDCSQEYSCTVPPEAVENGVDLYDYLVQDVCTDDKDNVISGDPSNCSVRRDIRVGENSPYIMTDFEKRNGGSISTYEGSNSIPVRGVDGYTKILITKSLQGNFQSNYLFNWDQNRDAYDLIDLNHSPYASYVRTSDPGCQDQIWSSTGSAANMAQRAGGWILFPTSNPPSTWPQSSSVNVKTYHIQVTPNRPGCGNGNSAGVTYWNRPSAYHFEAGKSLTAIRSFHFANKALYQTDNALEKYYFTKEYGFTRWESWVPQNRCFSERGSGSAICHPESTNYPLKGRCSVLNANSSPYPGLDVFGNQYWVMIDCRDHSNYVRLDSPQVMLDDVIAQNDGYRDIFR